ncbi:hypothetical protein U0070_006474, partial [Myodes glareolus]
WVRLQQFVIESGGLIFPANRFWRNERIAAECADRRRRRTGIELALALLALAAALPGKRGTHTRIPYLALSSGMTSSAHPSLQGPPSLEAKLSLKYLWRYLMNISISWYHSYSLKGKEHGFLEPTSTTEQSPTDPQDQDIEGQGTKRISSIHLASLWVQALNQRPSEGALVMTSDLCSACALNLSPSLCVSACVHLSVKWSASLPKGGRPL